MAILRLMIGVWLLFWAVLFASAQGLGDAAARERAKREREASTARKPAGSFGNDDLRRDGGAAPSDTTSASGAGAPPREPAMSSESGVTDRPRPIDRRRVLQDAVVAAETQVRALEEKIVSLEAKLNPMSPSFVYGAASAEDPAAAERRVREQLQQTRADLEGARQQLEGARRALADFGSRPTPVPES